MYSDTFHSETRLLGIFGHPIKHTFSPFIHNVAIKLLKLDLLYLPFDVPISNLKDAIRGITALGFKGFNVTLPLKESIIPHLHHLSEEASVIGSVNTVVNDLGKLVGYNTDVEGVYETLLPYKDAIANTNVTIIGAGGAARAAIYTIIRNFKPSIINIINRTPQKAETLKDYFTKSMKFERFRAYELFPPDLLDILRESKLIINATQVGLYPEINNTVIENKNAFAPGQLVFDFVYNPVKTRLLREAEEAGAVPIDGLKMLVSQAARSFSLWTGHQMPAAEVQEAIYQYINTP